MKAISLLQPFASLIAIGAKRFETRSWMTNYRGPLAIHASGAMRRMGREACAEREILQALTAAGYDRYDLLYNPERVLPLGKVVAVARLAGCVEIPEDGKWTHVLIPGPNYADRHYRVPPLEPERCFGDYTPGRYAWILEDIQPVEKPVTVKGTLGLWEWKGSYEPA